MNGLQTQSLRVSLVWTVLSGLLFVTNTTISPGDFLTKISALDSLIYLSIADSAPGLPPDGSNLVYHGAMRFLLPYTLGLLAKGLGVSSWAVFRVVVHLFIFATIGLFWNITGKLRAHFSIRLIATALICFHVYLFRLQLAFSGFLNDALFVLGMTFGIWSILSKNRPALFSSILMMGIGKQTVFFVLPVFFVWSIFDEFDRRKWIGLATFWLCSVFSLVGYYALIHSIVSPFSTAVSTTNMAFGLISFMSSTPIVSGIKQLGAFFGLGFFGILGPIMMFLAVYIKGKKDFNRDQACLLGLFIMAIVQPFLSGPLITDRSIMRLESLGILPFVLVAVSLAADRQLSVSKMYVRILVAILFVASFHHLFSIIGPDMELRLWFSFLNVGLLIVFFIVLVKTLRSPTESCN